MGRDATLLSSMTSDEGLLRKLALVIAGSVFIALAAKVSVPMIPVPMSLQTLAILLVGFAFGSKLGAVTLIAYLAQGAAGLPMFTPTTAMGPAAFAGPTAGFLIGFVFMAWAAGWAVERGFARGFVGTALAGIVISALLYIPGVAWPMLVANTFGLEAGWIGQNLGFYITHFTAPFVIGDILKALIAALVITGAWAALKRSKNA